MRSIALLVALSFALGAPAGWSAAGQDKVHYPTTHGSEILGQLPSLDGQTLSVEVKVTEVARGAYGKPYVRTVFEDGKGPLWLAPIVGLSGSLQAGDIIHVMGYVASVNGPEGDLLRSVNRSGYHLLAVCYYNFRTKNGLFYPFGPEPNQCSRWRDGAADGR